MEQELDLRPYIDAVVRHWRLALAVIAMTLFVAAAANVWVLPRQYEAVATVVAPGVSYQMAFDPKIKSLVNLNFPAKAYAALAKNAALYERVIAQMGDALPQSLQSVEGLAGLGSVTTVGDGSIIQLRVRYRDPVLAARIANTWSALYVEQINALYGQSADDLEQLDKQITTADQELEVAEQALFAFQKVNPVRTLDEMIEGKARALAAYVDAETRIGLALQDAQSLQELLQAGGTVQPTLAGELSALLIELKSLGVQSVLGEQAPSGPELQIAVGGPRAEIAVSEQVAYLDQLITAFGAKQQALVEGREAISEELRGAQAELEGAQAELDRLTLARDVARDAYQTLSRKADEVRIAIEVEPGEVRLASYAVVPEKPVSPRVLLNMAIAGMLGLMLGIASALVRESSRQSGR